MFKNSLCFPLKQTDRKDKKKKKKVPISPQESLLPHVRKIQLQAFETESSSLGNF